MWQTVSTGDFSEWFATLGEMERAEVMAKVRLLEQFGPHLKRPYADTLKGSRHSNMKELRASTANSVLRVAFAFDPLRSAILLVGGNKSGVNERRFYKQLIERADNLFDIYLRQTVNLKKGDSSAQT